MDNGLLYPHSASRSSKAHQVLRLIRAAQPISRTGIAARLSIDRSTVTDYVTPLIRRGILQEEWHSEGSQRKQRYISFAPGDVFLAGVNLGVRRTQVGLTTLAGEITDEVEFDTPERSADALHLTRECLIDLRRRY